MPTIPDKHAIDALGRELQQAPIVRSIEGQRTYLELMEFAGRELQQIEAQIAATVESSAEVVARVKSIETIHDKLVRLPSLKLSQMDDLIGVRVVQDLSLSEQTELCRRLQELFPNSLIKDRRVAPKSGYRAAHVIVRSEPLHAEIQVRTSLQASWADVYEGIADKWGRGIRYDEPVTGSNPAQIEARQGVISLMQDLSLRLLVDIEELRDALDHMALPLEIDFKRRHVMTRAGARRRVAKQQLKVRELMDRVATMAGEIE